MDQYIYNKSKVKTFPNSQNHLDHFLFEIVHDMRYFFPANIVHGLIFLVALFRADKFHTRTYFTVTPILRTWYFKVNEAGIASI